MASKLGWWLSTLTPDQLTEIMTRRPDSFAPPAPRTLVELAERLETRASISSAFQGLPQPAVQIIETLQSLGGPAAERSTLAEAFGRPADDPDLDAALQVLALRALVWPDGSLLRMADPLWTAFPYPLRLGPPAERLFSPRGADELRAIAANLGVAPGPTKRQLIADLVAALRDPQLVQDIVAQGKPDLQAVLREVAWNGPLVHAPQIIYGYGHSDHPMFGWAMARGLLVADGWQSAVMPAEVARALRGADWCAPFTPRPPEPTMAEADAAAVARESAAAASAVVAAVTSLLELSATAPISLLKAGGVGVREQKRLAKVVGADEATARLWLELAYTAGLVAVADDVLLPTAAYDAWRAEEPAERLVPLLQAWWRLPALPLAAHGLTGEPAPAALIRSPFADAVAPVRQELVRAVAALPPGRRVTGDGEQQGHGAAVAPLLAWRAPMLLGSLEEPEAVVDAVWQEAALLGVVVLGAPTPLCEALLKHCLDGILAVARELLPPAETRALFQADLTAVVPGTPSAALSALLDSAADRESAGGAATWRFGPASVRRAFDTGMTADELLCALREAAAGGTLPQPLEYLVGDVARRHGEVRVRSVACVIRSADPRLLTEVAAVRALKPLRLSLLAPTVLASAKPAAETMDALRAVGYAPVGEAGDGSTLVERVTPRRATPRQRRPGPVAVPPGQRRRAAEPPTDPLELAGALLGAGLPPEPAPRPKAKAAQPASAPARLRAVPDDTDDPAEIIEFFTPKLASAEQRLLTHAVEHGGRVEIVYTNAQGNSSVRVIEPTAVLGHLVEAWCHLRDDERMFALERIEAVAPA